MPEEKKFEGATFISEVCISRESLDNCGLMRKEMFRNVIGSMLDRVKYDLVEEMMIKNPIKDKWPPFVDISNEQIEKFFQNGFKITIIGKVKEGIEEQEEKQSTEFAAYAAYLRQLHEMFKEGEGESEGAEAIREDMFDIWKKLNKDEQNKGRELSIALKTSQSTP